MYMHILEWDDFTSGAAAHISLSLTLGVFDGIHLGHQALIQKICQSGYMPAIITFKQNPLEILNPRGFSGNIYSLERKLEIFAAIGVKMAVLIDFSEKFSKLKGRNFIGLLLQSCRMKQLVLGQDFRCGYSLDTGVAEITEMAGSGVAICSVPQVMEGGIPVRSSRIRNALCAGNFQEAGLLLGRKAEIDVAGLPVTHDLCGNMSFNAHKAHRILPPEGSYKVMAYYVMPDLAKNSGTEKKTRSGPAQKIELIISVKNGNIIVPCIDNDRIKPVRLEFKVE